MSNETRLRQPRAFVTSARLTSLAVSALFAVQLAAGPAAADNKMGYQIVTPEQASALPRAGGSLGMKIGPEEMIDSEGLHFAVLKVEGVQPSSPAAQAGLKVGDQIIAVNSRVFPNVAAFAGYVGSVPPGQQIEIDFMPAGGGPKQAQRVGVTVGEAGHAVPPHQDAPQSGGRSTGDNVAVGLGAAAIFGCYEYNCYSRLKEKIAEERAKKLPRGPTPPVTTAAPQPQ